MGKSEFTQQEADSKIVNTLGKTLINLIRAKRLIRWQLIRENKKTAKDENVITVLGSYSTQIDNAIFKEINNAVGFEDDSVFEVWMEEVSPFWN